MGLAQLDHVAEQLTGAMDPLQGGLRGAPKFPQCSMLEFLWRAAQRADAHRTEFLAAGGQPAP